MTDKKPTRGPTVAVIGGGLAGLATGCFLQLNGYHARIFEHAAAPGGVALTRWTPGHTVEGGVYFLLEHAPGLAAYETYEAVGAFAQESPLTVELLTCLVDQRSGARVAITRDLDALERDLNAIAPEDSALIEVLLDGARKCQRFDPVKAGFEKPPELQGILDKIAMGWNLRYVLSIFTDKSNMERSMTDFLAPMKSEVGKRMISMIFAYPDVPPFFVMMLLGMLARGQLGQLSGSASDFVDSIKMRFLSLGGELSLNSTVDRVLIEDSKAVGVALEDGTEHRAHAVVCTVDTRQMLSGLLRGGFGDEHTETQITRWKTAPPAGFVHFITSGTWDELPWCVQATLREAFTVAGGHSEIVSIRFFREGIAGANRGESVVQCCFEAGYELWKNFDEPAREALRTEVIAKATSVIEEMFPGFAERVLRAEVVSPEVLATALRAPEGVTSAWVPEPMVVNTPCPRMIHGLQSFYLAGQWAVGGAGIMAVLYSGRHAVQLLCHDDGIGFVGASSHTPA